MFDDSYPSRPSSHRRQYSRRTMVAHNSMPCTTTSDSEKCIAATQPQHQKITPEVLSESQVFEFLYGIIFSMIHTALMTILAPVLGDDKKKRSSKRRESSKISPTDITQIVEEGSYGIPQQQQQQLQPAVDNSDCISVASYSSQHSSRSHTHRHPTTILRRGSDPSSEKKNKTVRVQLPSRNVRAQPPLGRIGCSSQRSTTSSSSSSSSTNSSGSSLSSANSSGNSRERSSRPAAVAPVAISTRRARRSSPLRTMVTQRMAQTSYFLE